jgi:RNA polymerase sigma factor (sigma-70 family)
MQSRDTTLDLFSTFASLEGDRVRQWLSDARLRRNMQICLKDPSAPDNGVAEAAWSLYWYKVWQSHQESQTSQSLSGKPTIPTSQQHLAAYLQEPCYWAALQAAQRFPKLEFRLSDYFQVVSSETTRVLKGFNPQFGIGLKSYASIVFNSVIKDYLRQRRAIDICGDWLLLRKTSQKRITEVLHHAGINPDEIEQYNFAWICFKTISVPMVNPRTNLDKSQHLDGTEWTAISELYNHKRNQQLSKSTPSLTPAQLEARLTKLVQWIRQYLYPSVDSLNRLKSGQDDGELQDDLADPVVTSLLEVAIEEETRQERQQQRSQVHDTLTQAVGELDEAAEKILRLFYQENLSQQELAARMEMSQPTVSRRLKKAEEALLTVLLDRVEGQMNKSLDPSELKQISIALKEWLASYYRRGVG